MTAGPLPPVRATPSDSRHGDLTRFAAWLATLLGGWTLTWLLYLTVFSDKPPGTEATVLWITAKIIVWLLPVLVVARRWDGPAVWTRFGLATVRGWRAGALVVALWMFGLWLVGRATGFPSPRAGLDGILNACLVSPILEEILFRGFALRHLRSRGLSFWSANGLTTLAFLALHVPGWLFMDVPAHFLPRMAATVGFMGFALGALSWRLPSLWVPIVLHMVNNAWDAGGYAWLTGVWR